MRGLLCGKLRRFLQTQADVATNQAQGSGEQKRNAPAPFVQVFGAHEGVHACHHQRAEQQTCGSTGWHEAGVKAAVGVSERILCQESRSARILT